MIPNPYNDNYKLLLIPPIILLIAALFFIPSIKLGVEFQGGTLITISLDKQVAADELQTNLELDGLEAKVTEFETAVGPQMEIELPQSELLLDADKTKSEFLAIVNNVSNSEINANQNESSMQTYLEQRNKLNNISDRMFVLAKSPSNASSYSSINKLQQRFNDVYASVYSNYQDEISGYINKYVSYNSIAVKTISPTLSASFLEKAIQVIMAASILSIIFVFIFFRELVPSIAVLTGAFADIIIALGAMGFFGIPITIPSLAAILMLIGFSLDTDILLTTRMLRRGGNPRINAFESMKTGMTMSLSSIIAFTSLFALAVLMNIPTFFQISSVALAGLVADLFATWGLNGVMLIWYVENKKN